MDEEVSMISKRVENMQIRKDHIIKPFTHDVFKNKPHLNKKKTSNDSSEDNSSDNSSDDSSEDNSSDNSSTDSSEDSSSDNSSDDSSEDSSSESEKEPPTKLKRISLFESLPVVQPMEESIEIIDEYNQTIDGIEWEFPYMTPPLSKEEMKTIKLTDGVTTPYHFVIPFWMSGKPCHCKEWELQFNKNVSLEKNMEDLTLNPKKRKLSGYLPHIDLFPMWFSYDKGYDRKTPLFDKLENSDKYARVTGASSNDICIKMTSKLTMILRPKPFEFMRDRDRKMMDHVDKYLPMATHHEDQVNIYGDDVRNPMLAWIFHLLLNERAMPINCILDPIIHVMNGNNIYYEFKAEKIYHAMYKWYSMPKKK